MRSDLTKIRFLPALAAALLLLAGTAMAQSAEELKRLENLSPEERTALLESLGQPGDVQDEELSQPVLVKERQPQAADRPAAGPQSPYPDIDALEPFGYDLFAGEPTTFAPATDIPVPVDYVIGPGDTVEIQLFGNQNTFHSLVVGRDGVLNVPDLGPVTVTGLKFADMTAALQQRVSEQMIGVNASITMGPLRSIRIFVLGDAYRPGSYTVSALSTMTNALFVSGGISSIGSLRNIQLKRNGKVVTRLDLYDLLLRGDTSGDRRLQPGDVIFVPPLGKRVGIGGEVRRPAAYEIRNEKTVADVIELAGGMLPSAYPEASQIMRISPERERIIVNVDLGQAEGLATRLAGDDLVTIFSVLDKRSDIVVLQGSVYRPGPFEWDPGMRLSDLLPSIRELPPRAFPDYVMIRRQDPATHEISVLSANLKDALASPGTAADVPLQALDQVMVFNQDSDRRSFIDPVIEDLRLQSRRGRPTPEVRVLGRVRSPGLYPLEAHMRVSDLVRAAGYLMESAYALEAELTRYAVGPGQQRETTVAVVDLAAALDGDQPSDLVLQAHDILTIKEIPQWREAEVVSIEGEVQFGGAYPIRRGEQLSSVLQRAGGLTPDAFPRGAIFLREDLREREEQQIAELATRLEGEMQSEAAEPDANAASIEARRQLLEQVRSTEATGRLVIDLPAIMNSAAGTDVDIVLRDGDRLLVPRQTQTVTIVGEVQFPTSYVFEDGISRDEYVSRSGGTTSRADRKRVYIVRADGSVIAADRGAFGRTKNFKDIRPGDTIVVPLKPDPISTLGLWTSVTTVIYNIGVAAAAVASF